MPKEHLPQDWHCIPLQEMHLQTTYRCQVSDFLNNILLTPEMLSILLSPAPQHNQKNARSICVCDRKHHTTPQFSPPLLQNEAI